MTLFRGISQLVSFIT